MVTELALEETAEENTSGVVMAVPSWRGGSAGTGGMPGPRELVRGARELRVGAAAWFGSEILRERPGCSLWMRSASLVGLSGLVAPGDAGIGALYLATGFISRSSCELAESLELSTGDGVASPFLNGALGGSGTRPVDILLDDRLVRAESTTLSTSLPFSEVTMSIGL
jgi:hypothetical protein